MSQNVDEKIKKLNQEKKPIPHEFGFLMLKWLEKNCPESFEPLREKLEGNGHLGNTADWDGSIKPRLYRDMKQTYKSITPDHLLDTMKKLISQGSTGSKSGQDKTKQKTRTNQSLLFPFLDWYKKRENFQNDFFIKYPYEKTRVISSLKDPCMFKNYRKLKTLRGHFSAVYCCIINKSGDLIFTAGYDRIIKCWSAHKGLLICTLKGHFSEIIDLAISPDDELLASGSIDCSVRIWEAKRTKNCGQQLRVLAKHTKAVRCVKFCPNWNKKQLLLSCSEDGQCIIWNLKNLRSEYPIVSVNYPIFLYKRGLSDSKIDSSASASLISNRARTIVYTCAWSNDAEIFFCGGNGGALFVLAVKECEASQKISHSENSVDALTPHERESEHQKLLQTLSGHKNAVVCLEFFEISRSNSGHQLGQTEANSGKLQRLISASYDSKVMVWVKIDEKFSCLQILSFRCVLEPVKDGFSVSTRRACEGALKVERIALSCDFSKLAVSGSENIIQIWDMNTYTLLHCLESHESGCDVLVIKMHPRDPRIMISAGHDGNVILWDIEAGVQIKKFPPVRYEDDYILDGCFNARGTLFAFSNTYGHLNLVGLGSKKSFVVTPLEQFFSDDYNEAVEYSIKKKKVLVDSRGREYVNQPLSKNPVETYKMYKDIIQKNKTNPIFSSQTTTDNLETEDSDNPEFFKVVHHNQDVQTLYAHFEEPMTDERPPPRAAEERNSEDDDSDFEPRIFHTGSNPIRESRSFNVGSDSDIEFEPPVNNQNTFSNNDSQSSEIAEDFESFKAENNDNASKSFETENRTRSGRLVKKPKLLEEVTSQQSAEEKLSRKRKNTKNGKRNKSNKSNKSRKPKTENAKKRAPENPRQSKENDFSFSESATISNSSHLSISENFNKTPSKNSFTSFSKLGRNSESNSEDESEFDLDESVYGDTERDFKRQNPTNGGRDTKLINDLLKTEKLNAKLLSLCKPLIDFYIPQVGDRVVYLFAEQKKCAKKTWAAGSKRRLFPWEKFKLEPVENCEVLEIIPKISETNNDMHLQIKLEILKKNLKNVVINVDFYWDQHFIVLAQKFYPAVKYDWKPKEKVSAFNPKTREAPVRAEVVSRVGEMKLKVSTLTNEPKEENDFVITKRSLRSKSKAEFKPESETFLVFSWQVCLELPNKQYKALEKKFAVQKIQKTQASSLLKFVSSVLVRKPFAELFLRPVNNVIYPDYSSCVPHPIDLGLIQKRLSNEYYRSIQSFFTDIQQLVRNTLTYNGPSSFVTEEAQELEKCVLNNVLTLLSVQSPTSFSSFLLEEERKDLSLFDLCEKKEWIVSRLCNAKSIFGEKYKCLIKKLMEGLEKKIGKTETVNAIRNKLESAELFNFNDVDEFLRNKLKYNDENMNGLINFLKSIIRKNFVDDSHTYDCEIINMQRSRILRSSFKSREKN